MTRYTIEEFVQSTAQDETSNDFFQLENERMLEVNLDSRVRIKAGATVAYGQIKFTREGLLDKGLGSLIKCSVTGEGPRLTKAEGGEGNGDGFVIQPFEEVAFQTSAGG